MIWKVTSLRRRGLSFREIAKEIGKDVKTVHRWFQYGTGAKKFVKPGRPSGDEAVHN